MIRKFIFILTLGLLIQSCQSEERQAVEPNADLTLLIPDSAEKLLDSLRLDAIDKGVIKKEHKQEVEANIVQNGDTIPVSIRLKGDWTDHLKGDKVSYRVKVENKTKIYGLSEFSLQDPETRNGMHEWYLHHIYELEGLLTTYYEFVTLNVNDEYKGVYALEEHFEDELLIRQHREPGVILKFTEDGLWELRSRGEGYESLLPTFDAAVIEPFRKKKTMRDPERYQQFLKASKLVYFYQSNTFHPEEIFDMAQIGKYYALLDWANVKHAHIWHNLRFYYNVDKDKLEFVAFDMEPFAGTDHYLNAYRSITSGPKPKGHYLEYSFFKDSLFRESYLFHLSRFTSIRYMDSINDILKPEIDNSVNLFNTEKEGFEFNLKPYYQRSEEIKKRIGLLEKHWDNFMSLPEDVEFVFKENPYPELKDDLFVKDISLNTYVQKDTLGQFEVYIENFHLADIKIIGIKFEKSQAIENYINKPILISAYEGQEPGILTILLAEQPKCIYFIPANNPHVVIEKKVIGWEFPGQ